MTPSTLTNIPTVSSPNDSEVRQLISDLCRHFYDLGWATGTGGGLSIRSGDRIYMAPSGVQKERISPDDIFVLDSNGTVIERPAKDLTVSACRPLFMHAYRLFHAGAVIHSHSQNAMLATLLYKDAFRIQGLEMIKGIEGMGCFDTLEVPIIENTAREAELSDTLEQAMKAHPKTRAVLVRGHGVYVWGKDWMQAKTQAECYDYLFAASIKMRTLGINPENPRGTES
jgi:methylthioribulose-1-phosphate dehydratase